MILRTLGRPGAAIALAQALLGAPASAAPVADVLQRPALSVARAAQSMLLGASQAGGRVVAVGERGIIVVSDDAARSWRQAQVPVSVTLTAVRMVDAKVGYAIGHGGVVLASDDGGQTWLKRTDGAQLAQVALRAARSSGDAAALKEAERLVADGADKPLLDLHFFDARRGWVVGAYNLAFATEDGGHSWQSVAARLDNPRALHLYALRARGDTLLLAGEQGLVLLSGDAGRSFRRLDTPYHGSFFTAELPGDERIVVAGLRGNAWQSDDRGRSWVRIELKAPASFTASAVAEGQGLLLADQAGTLFSAQGGQWRARSGLVPAPLTALLPLPGGALLALGRNGAVLLAAEGAAR